MTLCMKLEFETSYHAMLRTHAQCGVETIAAYAARTTDVCSIEYSNLKIETQLSLAIDHFTADLVNSATREFLLKHRTCRLLCGKQHCKWRMRAKISASL